MTDQIQLAVYRDCDNCKGNGRVQYGQGVKAQGWMDCPQCHGNPHGKVAIYIPIDELANPIPGIDSLSVVRSIRDWMAGHDAAVDDLAAQLDASGLIEEPKQPAGREEFADGRDHLTVSGTFQSDKFPWCPSGFVPLKITDPAARDLLAEYARRREPIDKAFPLDLLEALENVPAKANPKYKPFRAVQTLFDSGFRQGVQLAMHWIHRHVADQKKASGRSSYDMAWRDSIEVVDAMATTRDSKWLEARIEYMRGVVGRPITAPQAMPPEVDEKPADAEKVVHSKATPDLPAAARALVDILKDWHVTSPDRGEVNLAIVEVKECLDGRGCALPRPYRVESALAMMDTVARNNGLPIPDTVCLLHAILLEAESLACQVIVNAIGYDLHSKLRAQVALEVAGEGDIVSRPKPPNMCGPCNGTGEVQGDDGPEICSACNGSGAPDA